MKLSLIYILLIASVNSYAVDASNAENLQKTKVSPIPAISPKNSSITNNDNPANVQYVWPAFSGPVTIDIKFDKPRWIGKIELYAYASPTKNIDQAEIGILDEEKGNYETVDIINNNDSSTADKNYKLSSKCIARKAKALRLTLTPPYLDLPLSLHHISLEAHDEKPAAWAKNPESETQENIVADSAKKISISSQKLLVSFDKSSGEIVEVLSLPDKTSLVKRLGTYAFIQNKTSENLVQGEKNSAFDCRVEAGKSVEFKCNLPGQPGVVLVKKYILENDCLKKRVEVKCDAPSAEPVFISFAERLILPNKRMKDIIYAGGDPWYSPRVWPKSIICETRQSGAGVSHGLLFLDNKKGKSDSLALVRLTVDDRFVWPLSGAGAAPFASCYYYPDGGRIPMATFRLSSQPSSYEVVLLRFQGDELSFAKKYCKMPLVAKEYGNIKRPAWLRDVLCMAWLSPAFAGDAERQVKKLLEMTERGYILVVLNQPFVFGDFGENPKFMNIWGATIQQEDYKKLIAKLKSLSPRVKVALYTWIWTGSPASKFFAKNVNAFVTHDKTGPIANAYPGLSPTFQRRMCDKKGYQHLAGQYRKLTEIYDVDFLYLDGGAGGGGGIDWGHGTVDQDYMWQDFYAYMRLLASSNAEGAMMFNSKCQPLADLGISEMGLDAFQKNPGYITNRIWGGKIQEAIDPLHRTIPVYWGYSDPYYSNVCVGMGLVPCIECAGLSYSEQNFILIKSPILTLVREMLDCKPVGLIPGLFPDSGKSKIDGYSLSRQNSLIMSLINREESAQTVSLSVPAQKLPVSSTGDWHVWQTDMRNPAAIKDIYSESQQMAAYHDSGWLLQKTADTNYLGTIRTESEEFDVRLNSKLLTLISASPSCAVVMAIDGLPMQTRQSSVSGVTVNAIVKNDTMRLDIISDKPANQIDILCALPSKKMLQDTPAGILKGYLWKNEKCFAVLAVQGNKSYNLKLADCPARKGAAAIACRENTVPGEAIIVEVKHSELLPLSLEIVKENEIIATYPAVGNAISVNIPKLARAGKYIFKIVAPDSPSPLSQTEVSVQNEIPIPHDKFLFPEASKPEIQPVKDSIVSRTALSGGGGNLVNGSQLESLNLKKREMVAGMLNRPFSRWGYSCAGMELRKVRWLKLKAESNIASAYCVEPRRKGYDGPFAGIVIDYSAGGKYARRVALDFGLGKFHGKAPLYGKEGMPDEQVTLEKWITYKDKNDIVLDLKKWAPKNWDGACWISVFAGKLLQGRFVKIKIEDTAQDIKPLWADSATNEQSVKLPLSPPSCDVRQTAEQMVIDGKASEKSWDNASIITDFRILGNPHKQIEQKTKCRILYDRENLYFFFECSEKPGNDIKAGRSDDPWYDDSIEVFLADENNKKSSLHVVVSAGGTLWSNVKDAPAQARTMISPGEWKVELKVPFKALAKNVRCLANLCRNRPIRVNEAPDEFFCWARIENGNYSLTPKYGTLKFK